MTTADSASGGQVMSVGSTSSGACCQRTSGSVPILGAIRCEGDSFMEPMSATPATDAPSDLAFSTTVAVNSGFDSMVALRSAYGGAARCGAGLPVDGTQQTL